HRDLAHGRQPFARRELACHQHSADLVGDLPIDRNRGPQIDSDYFLGGTHLSSQSRQMPAILQTEGRDPATTLLCPDGRESDPWCTARGPGPHSSDTLTDWRPFAPPLRRLRRPLWFAWPSRWLPRAGHPAPGFWSSVPRPWLQAPAAPIWAWSSRSSSPFPARR